MSPQAVVSGGVRSRSGPRLLVAGSGPGLDHLRALPQSPGHGLRYEGPIEQLADHLDSAGVSHVALCLDDEEWAGLESLVQACISRGIDVTIPVPEDARASSGPVAKRSLDLVGSLCGLVLLAPLLAAVSLAILIDDGRPVVFRQHRAGQRGRPFKILKFRTMRPDADALRESLRAQSAVVGAAFKIDRDPRVTRLGRWLRRTSIDELPQLWNVLRGEMSLVGPRPHPYDDLSRYQSWHFGRLAVKPGITGLWQLELRGDAEFDRWVEKDLEYIRRHSTWLDLRILLRTIPAVLKGSGR